MKIFWTRSFSTLIVLMTGMAAASEAPQINLQRITLTAGIHQIETQVAISEDQHATGLMFRDEMPANEGMLFIFEKPEKKCFWMRNTRIPLTAAFVEDDGTIVNLEDMKPLSLESHCSSKPVRYVLEMNLGWFAKKGVKPGSKLGGKLFNASRK